MNFLPLSLQKGGGGNWRREQRGFFISNSLQWENLAMEAWV